MKAGGDTDGLWTNLEFGIGYVPANPVCISCNIL